jgi:hypothetical protein
MPFGQKTEVYRTLNVSRGGLLVPCKEHHAPGMQLWVTFPYDISVPYGQPEIVARVVRSTSEDRMSGGANVDEKIRSANAGIDTPAPAAAGKVIETHVPATALHFEVAPHPVVNADGLRPDLERRARPRHQVALPIRVRPEQIPWFEEAMTLEVSTEGLRFLGTREYEAGQHLIVSFEPSGSSPWPAAAEFRSIVLRVEPALQSPALAVTICRVP